MSKYLPQTSMYLRILPVLFLEYLSISVARTLIPILLIDHFQRYSYIALGVAETVKGLLAFWSCPMMGRLSDRIGRKPCIFISMIGTTMPVCVMAITKSMWLYLIALGLSGAFSATFSLTFAFIADCLGSNQRAPAYGLALATFGCSFTLGPVMGSYIAQEFGARSVFWLSCFLAIGNCSYILYMLPETAKGPSESGIVKDREAFSMFVEHLPSSFNVMEAIKIFRRDSFMSNLAIVVFLYYISVWALVSTLIVFITQYLKVSPVSLGWLLSGYGLATMISESIFVRLIVPRIGEMNSIRLGLLAFAVQCFVISISNSMEWIAVSVLFSMFANLVYPSVSSLVSRVVGESQQGEALGALNGIKALTEGIGPLTFGLLMALFEGSAMPGAPYLICSILTLWALLHTYEMPQTDVDAEKMYSLEEREDTMGLLSKNANSEEFE